jgi:C_GCAxxG_C_C family probable redox protein
MSDVEHSIGMTVDLFTHGGLTCGQAIFTAFGEPYGIDPDAAAMHGRPLAGGVAGSGQICGYLVAAAQILALASADPDEGLAREDTKPKVAALLRSFEAKHGGLTCNQLLGVVRGTEEGERRIQEEGLIRERCPAFGRDAAELLGRLLQGDTATP